MDRDRQNGGSIMTFPDKIFVSRRCLSTNDWLTWSTTRKANSQIAYVRAKTMVSDDKDGKCPVGDCLYCYYELPHNTHYSPDDCEHLNKLFEGSNICYDCGSVIVD